MSVCVDTYLSIYIYIDICVRVFMYMYTYNIRIFAWSSWVWGGLLDILGSQGLGVCSLGLCERAWASGVVSCGCKGLWWSKGSVGMIRLCADSGSCITALPVLLQNQGDSACCPSVVTHGRSSLSGQSCVSIRTRAPLDNLRYGPGVRTYGSWPLKLLAKTATRLWSQKSGRLPQLAASWVGGGRATHLRCSLQ